MDVPNTDTTEHHRSLIGRVPVYVDDAHLSQAFAETLAPYLAPPHVAALAR